ncbi:nuclear transport factor 2 family protein [Myxococcota bacterium]|nr:nuclear transport factor 2 family protein [Myxococcota bacterium]
MTPREIHRPNPEWLAQAQLDAYNARDVKTFVSLYAPDVEIYNFPMGKPVMKGRAAMEKTYGKMFAANPHLHCRLVNRIVSGEFVTDSELVTGMKGRGEVRATAIYRMREGLIHRVWFIRH